MLLQPTLSLTIPSIYDNTVLDCRVYAPKKLSASLKSHVTQWQKKAVIVAHPYAPLGGCNDDPVVYAVTAMMLDQGFFVGTFNFRGAGTSKGRSSWTAKPETEDYTSFTGFMLHFMHDLSLPQPFYCQRNSNQYEPEMSSLSPIPSHVVAPHHISTTSRNIEHPLPMDEGTQMYTFSPGKEVEANFPILFEQAPLLLLAGYSYGALIVRRLPPLTSIIPLFAAPLPGTAASEIRLRAAQLAKQQNDLFACIAASLEVKAAKNTENGTSDPRRGRSLQSHASTEARKASVTASLRIGGEETDPELRRASHDLQQRSFSFEPERLRKSIDRFRPLGGHPSDHIKRTFSRKKGSAPSTGRSSGSGDSPLEIVSSLSSDSQPANGHGENLGDDRLGDVQVSYLLISPPQGLAAKLVTMWTFAAKPASKSAGLLSESERKLIQHDTLAVFGSEDEFSSRSKFYSWAEGLRKVENSKFQAREVDGAGHFWREEGVLEELRRHTQEFVNKL